MSQDRILIHPVSLHKDSPWLTVPPTEQGGLNNISLPACAPYHFYSVSALRDFRSHVIFQPSEVRDAAVFGMHLL